MEINQDAKKKLENRVARIISDIDVYDSDAKEITQELTSHFYDASMAHAQARGANTIEKVDVDAVLADSEDPEEIAAGYMRAHIDSLRRASLPYRLVALVIDVVLSVMISTIVSILIGLFLYVLCPGQIVFRSQSLIFNGKAGFMGFGSEHGVVGFAISVGHDVYGIMAQPGTTAGTIYLILGTLSFIATLVVYFIVMEGRFGSTPGKWLLGLRVLRENGTKIEYSESIVRNLIKMTFVITGLVMIEPLFIHGLFRRTRQSACDKLAGTMVVRRTAAIVKEVS
ncbi:MAG TPA: RDD family protein [Methanocella sp.]|nr:RDD family protein [Methanocella sp.]